MTTYTSRHPTVDWLTVNGGCITNERGEPFILRGMSLFWSQWIGQFYNADVLRWLKMDWKVNAVRAAMAVNYGGYRQHPEQEYRKIETVVLAAIEEGLYVVIDWHAHEKEVESASEFFNRISRQYANCPNVIFEIWNEPYPKYTWNDDIKPYHDLIIPIIRKNAPRNLIVVGTENYSQRVDVSAQNPLEFENIAYSVHFYAATHKQGLRNRCKKAIESRLALLVTEYGTCESTGDGIFAPQETHVWWRFLEKYNIGHFNWSIADKVETAAALMPDAVPAGGWPDEFLTPSGQLVKAYLRSQSNQTAIPIRKIVADEIS